MKKNGFSLVELVVGIGVMSVMALALADVISRSVEGQRTILQRQAAGDLQMNMLGLLGDRKICDLNFQNRDWNTDDVTRIVSAVGPDVVALREGEAYENNVLRVTGIKLANYRPYSTTGDDRYRGTMDLELDLAPFTKTHGSTQMLRIVRLKVELNGYPPAAGGNAGLIKTCVASGGDSNNIWTLKSNGEIYYTGFNVGVGTTAPSQMLHVEGNVLAQAYLHSSDARLKTNVTRAPGLAAVTKLRGVRFRWRDSGVPALGVTAQNVEAALPAAVVTNPRTGLKSVAYDQLIGPLIESVNELARENRALTEQVDRLEGARGTRSH